MNSYRFEGKYLRDFTSDDEAFEYALGFYDDRPATIEKRICGLWCRHSDPAYQPQHYEGNKNGGWMNDWEQIIE